MSDDRSTEVDVGLWGGDSSSGTLGALWEEWARLKRAGCIFFELYLDRIIRPSEIVRAWLVEHDMVYRCQVRLRASLRQDDDGAFAIRSRMVITFDHQADAIMFKIAFADRMITVA